MNVKLRGSRSTGEDLRSPKQAWPARTTPIMTPTAPGDQEHGPARVVLGHQLQQGPAGRKLRGQRQPGQPEAARNQGDHGPRQPRRCAVDPVERGLTPCSGGWPRRPRPG